jgi:hypothetical protein
MKPLIALALLVSSLAQAQQPSIEEMNHRLIVVAGQREAAQNSAAIQQAAMATEIERLRKELDAAKKECKPKDQPKEK